jgi:hypothetical protein
LDDLGGDTAGLFSTPADGQHKRIICDLDDIQQIEAADDMVCQSPSDEYYKVGERKSLGGICKVSQKK